MIELACKEIVFHFNKKHLEDASIPMWTIKTQGKSYYINHLESKIGWSTKETPDNPSTKGSIKFKNALLTIDDNNEATITQLTFADKARLSAQAKGYTRIIFWNVQAVRAAIRQLSIKHTPFKIMNGSCGTRYTICDIKNAEDLTALLIAAPKDMRILQPNEAFYKAYEDPKLWAQMNYDD